MVRTIAALVLACLVSSTATAQVTNESAYKEKANKLEVAKLIAGGKFVGLKDALKSMNVHYDVAKSKLDKTFFFFTATKKAAYAYLDEAAAEMAEHAEYITVVEIAKKDAEGLEILAEALHGVAKTPNEYSRAIEHVIKSTRRYEDATGLADIGKRYRVNFDYYLKKMYKIIE